MRIEPLGESAFILRELPCSPPEAARRIAKIPTVVEAYAAFETVGVIFKEPIYEAELLLALEKETAPAPVRIHEVPVLYDGEDLQEVARRAGLPTSEVVRFHAREYECRAVGFCPGFAYLAELPPEIDLPRRDSPRPRVAPGSVAIAAGMTAVYPLERPGGWWLIGRTPLVLVDEASDYFPIRAGDRVRFVAIDQREYASRMGERL